MKNLVLNARSLNGIDNDLIDQAANIERHLSIRRKRKTAIISGSASAVACFLLVFGIISLNASDTGGITITPPETLLTTAYTASVETTQPPVIVNNDNIVWNNGEMVTNRLAATFKDVTQNEWSQVFSFIPPEITELNSVSYSFMYSLDNPEQLTGGYIVLSDGLEEAEQFLLVTVRQIAPETRPLEEVTGISDIVGIDFEMSNINDTKVILSKIVDETGIWGTHVYGAFDCSGYRIEFEGRNAEATAIEFIKKITQ
ncbi:MAG: hypothetical protein FWD34_10390 [Oscillospiraceae bacterium]|nr:hypothetical protein [Oscillospiraceae bacterium]